MASCTSQHSFKRAEALRRLKEKEAGPRRVRDGGLAAVLAVTPNLFTGTKVTAVDRGISVIDSLPERLRGITTLYLSKNALTSLDGIEQFLQLRAVSAADNLLPDMHALQALTQLNIAAASFEGNPLADLPFYRQHVIVLLGPTLQLLDNRPVTAEERAAAQTAVAHEKMLLSLMLSNSCLVHKLGRCVQQVRLHTQLQCAVLGGQFGGDGGMSSVGKVNVKASGSGISMVLQLWDYEGSLGHAERRAIHLAIRREVARQCRRLVAGGSKPDSTRTWQQAYAAVALKQQETIAGLLQLLEEAKAEAAHVLAPITRPSSPAKRRMLQSGQSADSKLKQDREVLIQELRDAFLGLAAVPGPAGTQGQAADYEGRIRQLHAALEAAGSSGRAHYEAEAEGWEITAVRPSTGTQAALAATAPPPAKPALKSALKQPRSGGNSPAKQGQQQQQQSPPSPAGQLQWQPDDGLAGYEEEQQRCTAPRPFQSSLSGGPSQQQQQQQQQQQDSPAASSRLASPFKKGSLLAASPAGSLARHNLSKAASPAGSPTSNTLLQAASPAGSPASGRNSQPQSPACWTPNPLALCGEDASIALQDVAAQLQGKGLKEQVQLLQTAVLDYDATASPLSFANQELADALREMQDHALTLESQLQEEQEAAAALRQRHAEAVTSLSAQLQQAAESQSALRSQVVALQGERDAQAGELSAQARELSGLKSRVADLEAVKPVHLSLSVGYEAEWKAQCLRSAALESSCLQLQATVAVFERQRRLEQASGRMGSRVLLLRTLRRWHQAAVHLAESRAQWQVASSFHQRQVQARWLGRWRLAVQREKLIRGMAQQRQRQLLVATWQAWQQQHELQVLVKALAAAARVSSDVTLARQCFTAWQQHAAECRQVEVASSHPLLQRAQALQRQRVLRSAWSTWCSHMHEEVAPKLQQTHLMAARLLMGSQLRAWAVWQQYVEQRRRSRLLHQVADLHVLSRSFQCWQSNAAAQKQERQEALRGMLSNNVLLLRRAWKAWSQSQLLQQERAQHEAVAEHHYRRVLLAKSLAAWQAWAQLCRQAHQRQAARIAAAALCHWRSATRAAERKRQADAYRQARERLHFRQAFGHWRQAVADGQRRQARLAHAQRVLARRCKGRVVAAWRRDVLASKLGRTLEAVQELQGAVQRVSEELRSKAAEAAGLDTVRIELETNAKSLRVRITSLDADLAAMHLQAEQQAAALEQARVQCAAAVTAQQQAQAAEAAAAAQQAQAEAARAAALREAEEAQAAALIEAEEARAAALKQTQQAVAERSAAQQQAQQAAEEAQAARQAVAAAAQQAADAQAAAADASAGRTKAEQQAAKAAAEQDQLLAQCARAEDQIAQLEAARAGLAGDLDRALGELETLRAVCDSLQTEQARLQRQREAAEVERTTAEVQQQAALRQAERLAGLCEEQEQQRQQLEAQVQELQGMLASQSQLQEEVAALSRRNDILHAESERLRQQQLELTELLEQVQADEIAARQTVSQLRAEQAELTGAREQQREERERVNSLAAGLEQARAACEAQLQEAQALAEQLGREKEQLGQQTTALQEERDSLEDAVQELAREKQGLEQQVASLRERLSDSNSVLEACRGVLADSCARNAADAAASLSLQDMLQNLRAELLLKEAAIGTLTRQNEERCQRLTTVQQQVTQLRQQVAAAGATTGIGTSVVGPAAPCSLTLPHGLQPRQAPAAPGAMPSSRGLPVSPGGFFAQRHSSQRTCAALAGFPAPCWAGSSAMAAEAAAAAPAAAPATALAAAPPPPLFMPISGAPASVELAGSTAGFAPGALPNQLVPGLSEENLSVLMELVVEKRLSSEQANDVIAAAAGGNPAPLLSLLDQAKRRVQEHAGARPGSPQRQQQAQQQQQQQAQQQHGPLQQPIAAAGLGWLQQQQQQQLSPGTAAELAAVRQEIRQLRQAGLS